MDKISLQYITARNVQENINKPLNIFCSHAFIFPCVILKHFISVLRQIWGPSCCQKKYIQAF